MKRRALKPQLFSESVCLAWQVEDKRLEKSHSDVLGNSEIWWCDGLTWAGCQTSTTRLLSHSPSSTVQGEKRSFLTPCPWCHAGASHRPPLFMNCSRISPPWTQFLQKISTCSTMVSSTGCKGISALVPGTLLPSALTFVLAGLFLTLSSLVPHCCETFCPFLKMFSKRCHRLCWWAQLHPTWVVLGSADSNRVQHEAPLASFHRGHYYSPQLTKSCHINLETDGNIFFTGN